MSDLRSYFDKDISTHYGQNKIAKGLAIICKAKASVNTYYLRQMYYIFIYPYLIRCI